MPQAVGTVIATAVEAAFFAGEMYFTQAAIVAIGNVAVVAGSVGVEGATPQRRRAPQAVRGARGES